MRSQVIPITFLVDIPSESLDESLSIKRLY